MLIILSRIAGAFPSVQRSPAHAHHVAPHIRQIPMDWQASQSARAVRALWGEWRQYA